MLAISKAILSIVLLLALTTSQTQALTLTINNLNINLLVISGNLFCSTDGANMNGLSLPLANVKVTLNNGDLAIGSTVTAINGSFKINVDNAAILSNILSISDLKVDIALPISNCPLLSSTTGSLVGLPLVGNIVGAIPGLVGGVGGLVGGVGGLVGGVTALVGGLLPGVVGGVGGLVGGVGGLTGGTANLAVVTFTRVLS